MVPARRSLTFADLLIFVATAAVASALIRTYASIDHIVSFGSRQAILTSASLTLTALSLGTLALRFVPPRPPLRRLVHQPGFLAALAVASNTVTQSVWKVCNLLTRPPASPARFEAWAHNWLFSLWVPYFVGQSVFLACLIGMLGGFSLRRADWVERLGRLLACVWLLHWVLNMWGFFHE